MTTTTSGTASGATLFDVDERRVDGAIKVNGRAAYTADVTRPNLLWAAFAVSPIAHGRIVAIDATEARALPGVRAVLTGADVAPHRFGRQLQDWPVLAHPVVRFTGERVVAVAAETRAAAEEAAHLVDVTYDELPAVFEGSDALADDAPVLHPDDATYAFLAGTRRPRRHPNVQGEATYAKGDADRASIFARAAHVFEHAYTTPRQHHGFLEPHATLVWIDDDGTVHVHSPCKSPFRLRQQMARAVGVPIERIVVEPSYIGGDFGGKGLVVDEFACYFLARATGRPVKSVMRYVDELQGTNTRHRAEIRLRTAVDAEGRFLAHEADVTYNGGAYAAAKPSALLLPGGLGFGAIAYHVPHARLDVRAVYTNTVPAGNMRSPVDVQTMFAWEVHVDEIARSLGIDPLDLRLRNAIRDGQTAVTGEVIHAPRGVAVLEALRHELAGARPLPPGHGRGIAYACRETGEGRTSLALELAANAAIVAIVGVPDQGSGSSTVIQRVVAAELGIDPNLVRAERRNTVDALNDPGAGASRVTHVVGSAALVAARNLRALLEERAGAALVDGRFVAPGVPARSFAAVAAQVCAAGPVRVTGAFDSHTDDAHTCDYSFSAFAIEVAVDRETGAVRVADAVLIVDVATIINPVAHRGQIEGGFVYGLGGALLEELAYADGKLTTLSLGDYKLPTIADLPPLRIVHVEGAPGNGPFGAKMAGELSNSGVAPAIVNAVRDAVGVRLSTFPVTPERVFALLHPDPIGGRS